MNDYYNYLNGYNDMNFMTSPNTMIGDLNYQSLMPIAQNTTFTTTQNEHVLDSYEGFKKGNMFGDLYDPYRNYKHKYLILHLFSIRNLKMIDSLIIQKSAQF